MEKLIEGISKELVKYKEALIDLREHKYNQFYLEKFRKVERNLNKLRISFEKAPRSKKEGLGFIKDKLKKLTRAMTYESKNKILEDLEDSIDNFKEGKEISILKERIYKENSPFDFHNDIRDIIKKAKKEIFIVEPYIDEDLLEITLRGIDSNLNIKILSNSKNPKGKFVRVANKFSSQHKGSFGARETDQIHDRGIFIDNDEGWVMGQSIKQGGKKPTYLIKLQNPKELESIYNKIFLKSSKIR